LPAFSCILLAKLQPQSPIRAGNQYGSHFFLPSFNNIPGNITLSIFTSIMCISQNLFE
jgi:hypothetical protein